MLRLVAAERHLGRVLTWEATGMSRIISLLTMFAIVASCATTDPPRYVKPNASLDDVRRDMVDCAKTALGREDDPIIISAYPRVDRDAVDQCMRAKGYALREGG
jgi:hypothetical protein